MLTLSVFNLGNATYESNAEYILVPPKPETIENTPEQDELANDTIVDIENQIAETLIKAMKKDKKNASSKIRLVLQKGLNETFTEEIEDSKILAVLK